MFNNENGAILLHLHITLVVSQLSKSVALL